MEQENKVEEVEQPNKQEPVKLKESKTPAKSSRMCALRIRGITKVQQEIKDTLKMLNLHRKNHCVILDNNPTIVGMLKKAKDYIGEKLMNQQ